MAPKTKFKQLKGLFKDCRRKQCILFVLCMISVIANILLVYQIQSLIDSDALEKICNMQIQLG